MGRWPHKNNTNGFKVFLLPNNCQKSMTNEFWLLMIVGKLKKIHDRVERKRAQAQ
jgi:hypothetical protein